MKRFFFTASWVLALGLPVVAENRPESAGPLVRLNPAGERPDVIIAVCGDAGAGLTGEIGFRVERLGNQDKWCVEMNSRIAIMELDRGASRMNTREVLIAEPEWCLSPDGSKIFAARRDDGQHFLVWECFDFASGKSLWTHPQSLAIADACFTPDGMQLVVMDQAGVDGTETKSPVISWYDSATGARTRRVELPGILHTKQGDISTDYLGITKSAVYVSVPRQALPHGPDENRLFAMDGFMILPGAEVAVPLDLPEQGFRGMTQVRAEGGPGGCLAFYNEQILRLFREENGKLVMIRDLEIDQDVSWTRRSNVRFSPDRSHLLVSATKQTLRVPTAKSGEDTVKRFKFGWPLGDFSRDGKIFVSFDEGGGTVRDADTLVRINENRLQDHPIHCHPPVSATFSGNGNLIVSNDGCRLLLWSKEGRLLAELFSPNEGSVNRLEMQSPVFVDRLLKIKAADGWDFLEWDLNEIAARVKRRPVNTPSVVGTVVHSDRTHKISEPEVMNVATDPVGKVVVTGTRSRFLYRLIDAPDNTTALPVPTSEIYFRPRSLHVLDPSKIFVRTGSDTLLLDSEGKKPAAVLSQTTSAMDSGTGDFLFVDRGKLITSPAGLGQVPSDSMDLPADWAAHECRLISVSPDGKWIAFFHHPRGGTSSLAVVDRVGKKLVRDVPVGWTATTLEFSRDGTRLVAGASDRAIYVFDFNKLREGGK